MEKTCTIRGGIPMGLVAHAANEEKETVVFFSIILIDWIKELCSVPQNWIIFFCLTIILFLLRNKILEGYQTLIDVLRRKLNIPVLKPIIVFIITRLSSPIFSAIITIILPFVLEIYFEKATFIIICWSVLVVTNAVCCDYSMGRNRAKKWFLAALKKCTPLYNDTEKLMFKSRKEIKKVLADINESSKFNRSMLEQQFNFDKAAQIVCDSIFEIIKEVTENDTHQVTVFRVFNDNTSDCPQNCPNIDSCKNKPRKQYVQMVGCTNKTKKDSSSSAQKHCVDYCVKVKTNEGELEKKHFYIHFFVENSNEIEVITGNSNIRKRFLFHEKTKAREEKIDEYVGIPIFCLDPDFGKDKHTTYAVIQIDFQKKGYLGKTEASIIEFVENVFGEMTAYLNCCLQVEAMIERLYEHMEEIYKIKKKYEYDLKQLNKERNTSYNSEEKKTS